MNKNLLALVLISILGLAPNTYSQDPANYTDQGQINSDKDALIGKFVEEAAKIKRGTVKALEAEVARDKKLIADKNHNNTEPTPPTPSIESIEADLKARDQIAQEIEDSQ